VGHLPACEDEQDPSPVPAQAHETAEGVRAYGTGTATGPEPVARAPQPDVRPAVVLCSL